MTSTAGETGLFKIQKTPDKGQGVFATTDITAGTRIIFERPLFTTQSLYPPGYMEERVATQLFALTKEQKREFLSLHNNFPGKYPFSGIVKTNALPCRCGSVIGGVYAMISRTNHSCIPNTHHSWNSNLGSETIHAIRDICAGEEITISYDDGKPSLERWSHLEQSFGFKCQCELCTSTSGLIRVSDTRRRMITSLDNAIGDSNRVLSKPEDCLSDCRLLIRSLREEYGGFSEALLARAYYDAFQICITHADQARAAIFAERAYQARIICEGKDSPETIRMKSLMEEPSSHRNFGYSMQWRTGKSQSPHTLVADEFERWLWK